MLVLTRKLDQQIQIGEGITVTVLEVKGNTVKLGIAAPKEVRVLRAELKPRTDADDLRKTSPVDTTARMVRITDEERMMLTNPSPNYQGSNFGSAERRRPNVTTDRTADRTADRTGDRLSERDEARDAASGLIRRVAESPLRGLVMARR